MAVQSGSFSAAEQTSGWYGFAGNFTVWRGAGTGTVILEMRPVTLTGDATALDTGEALTAAGARTATALPPHAAEYRLRCSAFTSGPISYSIISG